MKSRWFVKSILVAMLISFSGFAKGVKVVSKTTDAKGNPKETSTIKFDNDNLSMESKGKDGHMIVLFRSSENKMVLANISEGTIMEITEKDLEKMGATMEQAQNQMKDMMNSPEIAEAMRQAQEKMKDLPKEQQEMMKKMMPNMGGGGMNMNAMDEPNVTYEKSGSETVNSWKTTKYIGKENGQTSEEVWTTDMSNFGLSESDFAVFKKMGKFFDKLSQQMGNQMSPLMNFGSKEAEAKRGYSGVPVKNNDYVNGKLASTTEVLEVTKISLSANDFKNPEGLKKQQMFDQMQNMKR
ncbi:MAG: hypothetical protein R3C41_19215 [Calditrichia bacterium]|nr:hypothetical protein [Calditrichota bacterium]MCB0266633.1 hypothetical protein [Calditrichota bacterium]MCB0285370.1 hypothetical protein [Calditrichota bacterium]MCB9068150.1 hypothetical protein [Calditrichia bacterium]